MAKMCPHCNIKHPNNYKKCAFCHGVLNPFNLKKDQAYDKTHSDPFGGGPVGTEQTVTRDPTVGM